MATSNNDDDKPLDPAVEQLRRKMVRLLVISIGIMMVGLMAVLGAIVYKVSARSTANGNGGGTIASGPSVPVDPGFEGHIDLPNDAEIVSVSLDGSNILLRVRQPGQKEKLLVYSLSEDRVIATVVID